MKRIFQIAAAVLGAWFQLLPPARAQVAAPALQNPLEQELTQLRQRLSDWPQLGYYQKANATLPLPHKDEPRIVFLGDSITEFWQLAADFPHKPYINRGIAGQTTPQMLLRFRPDVIALQPKAVLILGGTNDIAGNTGSMPLERIEDNYIAIAQLAQANHIQVIFASVLPIHDYSTTKQSQSRPPAEIRALNGWLRRYCLQQGYLYLNYYTPMLDRQGWLRRDLSDDGLHPNSRGYAVMATVAEPVLQQALHRSSRSPLLPTPTPETENHTATAAP